jgi:hypothetical protein
MASPTHTVGAADVDILGRDGTRSSHAFDDGYYEAFEQEFRGFMRLRVSSGDAGSASRRHLGQTQMIRTSEQGVVEPKLQGSPTLFRHALGATPPRSEHAVSQSPEVQNVQLSEASAQNVNPAAAP